MLLKKLLFSFQVFPWGRGGGDIFHTGPEAHPASFPGCKAAVPWR